MVTNGVTYRGATSSAGEWGHTTARVRRPALPLRRPRLPGGVRRRGGASSTATARRGGGRPVPGDDEESQLAALIAAAGTSADRPAGAGRDRRATSAPGVANLINLFNPERIVLGGWAGLALGAACCRPIRAAAAAHALRQPYEQASIELGRLGPDAVALGAATLPIARLLTAGGVRSANRRVTEQSNFTDK